MVIEGKGSRKLALRIKVQFHDMSNVHGNVGILTKMKFMIQNAGIFLNSLKLLLKILTF